MAEALVGAGAIVAVTSRSRQAAQAMARQLGGSAIGLASDVRDERSVAEAVDAVVDRFGGIDLLVNNAGIGMRTVNARFPAHVQPFWEVDPQGFRDVVDTKVTGVFLVARAVVPLMLAAGRGRIVNISMSETTMTRAGFVPYARPAPRSRRCPRSWPPSSTAPA
jgi:NAD(P)-dependent dehydrogenase (short-subunit alcohol dehydrogenase family)